MRTWVTLFVLLAVTGNVNAQTGKHTFSLGDSVFLLDGKPFTMISGELHYPRIPKEAWRHRMRMAKAMGLNTIGTYVFWNLHEPQKGKYDFTGNNNIAEFVKIAQEEGLWVVLRPSPYVCAEWEFGGYPYWLQNEKGLVVRSLEPKFMSAYKSYLKEVAKQLAPLQIHRGGNVVMVQLENEYGFYGSDKTYLETCKKIFIEAGFDGLLYTCDPGSKVKEGHLSPLLPAVNGMNNPLEIKQLVKTYHGGKGPYYVAEWYPAWFDWWGTKHHTVPAEYYASKLDSILAAGISINMYMFHGGTTRGFMNGANYNDQNPYEPQISSYDYDAPLDEAGNATEKFRQFRGVIEKHRPKNIALPPVPAVKPSGSFNGIELKKSVSVFETLGVPVKNATPLTFEDLDQPYGFVLYRTKLKGSAQGILKINDLRDFGVIYVNGQQQGVLDRRLSQDSIAINLPEGEVTLDILVENLGRINFGPYLLENRKGITQDVRFAGKTLTGWEMYKIPLDDISKIRFNASAKKGGAMFCKGVFQVDKPLDTYLDVRDWGKGCAWINGHHLGRYWNVGPQQTLYIPAEWLKPGANEIVIFDVLGKTQTTINTIEKPVLDQLAK